MASLKAFVHTACLNTLTQDSPALTQTLWELVLADRPLKEIDAHIATCGNAVTAEVAQNAVRAMVGQHKNFKRVQRQAQQEAQQ